ncbi:hypothetical protein TV39_01975 [Arthrobacter sp. SPG23]|uniref:hypothetical protein n=1 Tax=Arthrobacter sp. SPG23 TaxID=1610703 RepID=UPI0005BA37DC|nr:hypothetical protein [Arthrobacter sp. SPG23]KIS28917.1 hypothetical protein TV39_01975 [Arthrobacter sp. SPG23]
MEALDWLLDSDPATRWRVLRDLTGAPPEEVQAERARVATHGWGARLLALQDEEGQWDGGAYFGENVDGVVGRLLRGQLADGGWNCEAERGSVRSSFGTTINVLEGLLEYEHAAGGSPDSAVARQRGEEYLLENTHPGRIHFALEDGDGRPSRWNTLRALRVLQWFEGQ